MTGSITDLGESIKVNARMIDSESGQVVAVASVQIPKDTNISVLQGKTVALSSHQENSVSSPVSDQLVGIWKDSEDSKEFYYEIRKSGFVFYCELENGRVVDLDTGILNGFTVTYSGGDQENITHELEDSDQVSELPGVCR